MPKPFALALPAVRLAAANAVRHAHSDAARCLHGSDVEQLHCLQRLLQVLAIAFLGSAAPDMTQ